jgi:hypothetical protein
MTSSNITIYYTDPGVKRALIRQDAPGFSCLVEAAQNLWEAYIDGYLGDRETRPDNYEAFDQYHRHFGTVDLRNELRNENILAAVCLGIEIARADDKFTGCYDWEFCPWFLENCIQVGTQSVTLKHDWLDRCESLKDQEKAA